MGYMFVVSACFGCRRIITYNPRLVPSLNNEPICLDCVDKANPIRKRNGLPEIVVHPMAYEPAEAY